MKQRKNGDWKKKIRKERRDKTTQGNKKRREANDNERWMKAMEKKQKRNGHLKK